MDTCASAGGAQWAQLGPGASILFAGALLVVLVGTASYLGAHYALKQTSALSTDASPPNEGGGAEGVRGARPTRVSLRRRVSTASRPPGATASENPDVDPEHSSSSTPAAFTCCITSELFVDPVVAVDGHSYERAAIERWLQSHDTSPRTGERLPSKALVPNHGLRAQVHDHREALGLPEPPPWEPPPPAPPPR